MIFYMDDYRKARETDVSGEFAFEQEQFEQERLCVNWNPAVRALALSCYQRPQELSPGLPADLATVDVDSFLDQIYGLATQI
ncbi:MAG: hypothetical protein OEZ08_04115 [Betaproteobacteria bacterium]|nr:hypothetical protein [Betaproteobacteria bacterium]